MGRALRLGQARGRALRLGVRALWPHDQLYPCTKLIGGGLEGVINCSLGTYQHIKEIIIKPMKMKQNQHNTGPFHLTNIQIFKQLVIIYLIFNIISLNIFFLFQVLRVPITNQTVNRKTTFFKSLQELENCFEYRANIIRFKNRATE